MKVELKYIILEYSKDDLQYKPNEKYYWDSPYYVVSMSCTPAWCKEQHKIIDE